MIDYLGILIKKYGGILIAGIAGAIIRRIRESMTIIEFLQVLFLGDIMSFETNTDARNVGIAVGEVYRKSDGTLMIAY